MKIRWLGNATVEIIGEENILIDPNFLVKPKTNPDTVLVSHEHNDHFNIRHYNNLTPTELYAPLSVFENFDVQGEIIKPGDKIKNSIQVLNIDCYNARTSVGYYHKGVYQTGDASRFPEPAGKVKVLFTACFPDLYSEYLASCQLLEPEVVIPYHYNPDNQNNFKGALGLIDKLKKEGFNCKLLKPGEGINI